MEVSVVIIALNESRTIKRCVDSARRVSSDVIVLDNGSTDDTRELAADCGANVISVPWQGYGKTKNLGHHYTQNEWILSLDADEELSEALIHEIKSLTPKKNTIYRLNRLNHYMGKPIYHSGWFPDRVARIFPKENVHWDDRPVHEKLVFDQSFTISDLDNLLLHHSYPTYEGHLQKIETYARLKAQSWIENRKSPGLHRRIFGPLIKALGSYVLKGGFLDGREGWLIAKMEAHLAKRQIYYYDKLKNVKS